jgi:hypothetical protein
LHDFSSISYKKKRSYAKDDTTRIKSYSYQDNYWGWLSILVVFGEASFFT